MKLTDASVHFIEAQPGYTLGADPTCADGACVLPDTELQELMSETLLRRDPSWRVVISPSC